MQGSGEDSEICDVALNVLRSPECMFPVALAMHGESKEVYNDIVKLMMEGRKGSSWRFPFGTIVVEGSLLSCDLKAAALIYGCYCARSERNFCCYGCNVEKNTYARIHLIL